MVGVRIPRRSPRLDELAASQLAVELKQAVPGPESAILAVLADEQSVLSDVLSFVHEVQPVGARVAVIRSSASEISSPLLNLPTVEIHDIQLTDSIASTEASSLTDYISRLPKHLRATRWTLEDLESAAQRDPSFIELMYRLVDPARRSIRDIFAELEKEYPFLKENLLSAMGKVETSRLLDTRFLELDEVSEESGFFDDEQHLVTLQSR